MPSTKTHLTSLYKFNTIARLGKHIVRQLPRQGVVGALTVAYKALPLISKHIQINQLIVTNPHLAALIKEQPGLTYKYLGKYIATNFSSKDRLAILLNHYDYLNKQASDDFFNLVLQKASVWQYAIGEDLFTISLEFPFNIDFEGDLSLVFKLNQQPIYAISFTFIPAALVNGSFNQTIFISRLQGSKQFDLIKQATKSLHDITPLTLLVVALQGMAIAFGINFLVGVSTENQLYSSVEKDHFFDYNSFWEALSFQNHENFFHVPIPFPEKPLTSIKPNHRSRTLRKRSFKHQVCQDVRLYSQQHFLR